jgi:hypothetical protein
MLTYRVLFFHDQAHLHTLSLISAGAFLRGSFNDHQLYSPDLASSDYHLFTYQNELVHITAFQQILKIWQRV